MKIKKGDKIQVITGKDSGKTGSVTKVLREANKVVVDGINKSVKHQRARKEGEKGTKVEFSAPVNVSNVMVVCPKCSQPTRVGSKVNEAGKKSRFCKKCKATF